MLQKIILNEKKNNLTKFKMNVKLPNVFSIDYFCVSFPSLIRIYIIMQIYRYFTDDLSYNKIATQSHTFIGWNTYYPSSAIDRNASSCMRTKAIGRISTLKTVWWKVDLGGVYNIYSITILFKNYHGFGM